MESQSIWQSMYDMWTTLASYKQTNVVHEYKFKNLLQKCDNMWFTFIKKLNHILFEYFYKSSVAGKAEDWSYNVWNMNHINFLHKKECGSWKSVISECHNLWFTSKQKMNHFPSKYHWRNGIVEKAKYWTLNAWTLNAWNMNHICFLLRNLFGSLKMYIFENVTICDSH